MKKERAQFNFIGGSYSLRSKFIDTQECVNFYPEMEIPSSKNVTALIGTPGLKLLCQVSSSGAIRGLYATSLNRLFAVCGNLFAEISTVGKVTVWGQLFTVQGVVGMIDNGNELLIVDGANGYTFDLNTWSSSSAYSSTGVQVVHSAGSFAQIVNSPSKIWTDPVDTSMFDYAGFPANPTHCVFKDGFFVVNNGGTGQFFISEPYDGTMWNPLQFAVAEGSPDNLLSITKANNELVLAGDKSVEIWYNSGASPFPFQRIQSAFFDIGTAAKHSLVTNGEDTFWLGANSQGQGSVMHLNGYMPQRVSTHSIEYMISQLGKIDDAVGWAYQQEGHFFYVLTFPAGNRTFVYDTTTGLWHERGWLNVGSGTNDKHRAICAINFNQLVYVGDWQNGNVYQLDLNTYTDNGNYIKRIRTCPHIHYEMKRMFYHEFEIDCIKGQGLAFGQGVDPQAMLQWSNNAGFTWSIERWEPVGAMGQYKTRVHWHALGMARDRVFRFTVTDPIAWILVNAWLDTEVEDD